MSSLDAYNRVGKEISNGITSHEDIKIEGVKVVIKINNIDFIFTINTKYPFECPEIEDPNGILTVEFIEDLKRGWTPILTLESLSLIIQSYLNGTYA